MKSRFLFFVAVFVSASCFGQGILTEKKVAGNGKIKWGIKAGITVAGVNSKYTDPPVTEPAQRSSRVGIMGGGFAQVSLGRSVQFQPEILLVGKGSKEHFDVYSYKAGLTYLELPLNLLYKPIKPKGSFFLGGGPAPSFYIGENVFYNGNSYIKTFDFGINIISGYEWPIGFSIHLHYTHGLLNAARDNNNVVEIRNRCFGFSFGYTF